MDFLDGLTGNEILWGIAPWRLAAAFAIIFAGFASRKVIQGLFTLLGRKAGSTRVQWDDEATRLLAKPLAVVVQLLLWRLAAMLMLLPTEPFNTRLVVAQGLEAALMVALVWVCFRIIDVLASVADRFADSTKTRIDDQAVPLLRKTFKVFVGLLGFVFIVSNLGFNVLSVLAGLGIGGLALALAAQDSVANFFGSVVLFTDAPFQVDDYVEVGGVSGTVEEVGFRTTRIRQDDSSIVCVPNQTFTGSFITNYSERKGRVIAYEFGIVPTASPDALQRFVETARALLKEHVNVREDSVEVHLTGFGKWAVEVRVRVFTVSTGWDLFLDTQQELLLGLLRVIDDLGMTLARPSRSLYVHDAASGDGQTASMPFAAPPE